PVIDWFPWLPSIKKPGPPPIVSPGAPPTVAETSEVIMGALIRSPGPPQIVTLPERVKLIVWLPALASMNTLPLPAKIVSAVSPGHHWRCHGGTVGPVPERCARPGSRQGGVSVPQLTPEMATSRLRSPGTGGGGLFGPEVSPVKAAWPVVTKKS